MIIIRLKKVTISAAIALILSTLFISVYAHGGRTDANGGHYNRSTGEYHYHHGYSAHDHYDMDGDGVIDCPYNFKNKTNSGGNSSSSTRSGFKVSSTSEPKSPSNNTKDTAKTNDSKTKNDSTNYNGLILIGGGVAGFHLISYCVEAWGRHKKKE